MIINIHEYRDKALGCWMGKNIGSALGQPFEWKRKINDVTFYTQDLEGGLLPSVDLDIQLLWLRALEDHGVHIGTTILSEYYLSYLTTHSGGHGSTKALMYAGLMPPLSGVDNKLKDSTGAFTRSEIWACIAPGCPEIAARNAYQDATIDHGTGEGLYAAVFMAVVQAAAFIQDETQELINIGLSYIPEDCGVAKAIKTVLKSHSKGKTWLEARDKVLQEHRGHYQTKDAAGISKRDWDYGLADGTPGYDAPCNMGMVIIGWLYGDGDFARSICTTVNCGEDTDANAAALGALLGIIDGISCIPRKWMEPVSSRITTRTINAYDVKYIPANIDELTSRTARLAKIIMLAYRPDVVLCDTRDTSVSANEWERLANAELGKKLLGNTGGVQHDCGVITCKLDYPSGAFIQTGQSAKVALRLKCKLNHQQLLHVKWYLSDGFSLSPKASGMVHCPAGEEAGPYVFELTATGPIAPVNRFVIEITAPGRHSVALVPVVLLDGGFM